MSWPVAYRRAAPGAYRGRGIQPSSSARGANSASSRANARTRVSPHAPAVPPSPNAANAAAANVVRNALGAFGLPGRLAQAAWGIYDAYNNQHIEPDAVRRGAQGWAPLTGAWVQCNYSQAPGCSVTGLSPTHYLYFISASGCTTTACGENLSLGGEQPMPVNPAHYGANRFTYITREGTTVPGRWSGIRTVYRPNVPGSFVKPDEYRTIQPMFWPFELPATTPNPWDMPIGQPARDPMQVPWFMPPHWQPNPNLAPGEQTVRGPIAPQTPDRIPSGDPSQVPVVIASAGGRPLPGWRMSPNARMRTRPGNRINPKRPPRFTKERKVALTVRGIAVGLLNLTSEFKDLVEAIWKALPKNFQRRPNKGEKKVRLPGMLEDLYHHWMEVDMPLAMANILDNEIKDRMYGGMGNLVKRGVRRAADGGYYVGGVGLQAGGRYRPRVNDSAPEISDFVDLPKYSARDAWNAINRI